MYNDLTGQKFSRLTVVRLEGKNASNQRKWLCRCECGKEKTVMQQHLRSGNTQSCGCLRVERSKELMPIKLLRPGEAATKAAYRLMIARCHDVRHSSYSYYGGRGIVVCDSWRNSFDNFYEDMGPRPGNLSLDRIDNYKGYEPGNCRWATAREQALNRRNTVRVYVGEEEMALIDACLLFGVKYSKVNYRMRRCGMDFNEAVEIVKLKEFKKDFEKI